jgi:hypothetical protein
MGMDGGFVMGVVAAEILMGFLINLVLGGVALWIAKYANDKVGKYISVIALCLIPMWICVIFVLCLLPK